APLRRAVDGLSAGEPEKAMDMIVQLREAVRVDGQELETQNLRDTMTAAIQFLPLSQAGVVRKLLLEFMQRAGRGSEKKIAAAFATAELELGLELVRLLAAINSDESRDAIAMASNSP